MPTPRRPRSEARDPGVALLERAIDRFDAAIEELHKFNKEEALQGRAGFLEMEKSWFDHMVTLCYRLKQKEKSTTITGRSDYVPDLDDDEVDED